MVSSPDGDERLPNEPALVEDLLLLLFDPDSGTIAGEGTLFYVLAGAVLAELAASGRVVVHASTLAGGEIVRVADGGQPPDDALLKGAYNYVARKPTSAQELPASIGPGLRAPVLDRLVRRGYIRKERGRFLGIIPTTNLRPADLTRRDELLQSVRSVLVDATPPGPRIGAIAALLSASGSLPTFHPEIPWSTPVITRAKQLERGDWGAQAAEVAVTRTMAAIISGSIVAAVVAPKS